MKNSVSSNLVGNPLESYGQKNIYQPNKKEVLSFRVKNSLFMVLTDCLSIF